MNFLMSSARFAFERGASWRRHGWVDTTHLLKDDKINPWQPMRQSVAYVDPQ